MRAGAAGGFAPARLGPRFAAWFIDAVVCFVPAAIAYLALVYFTFHSQWYFQSASFFEVIEKGTELVFNYPVDYLHVPLITLGIWIAGALILCVIGGASSQTLGRKITGVRLVQSNTGNPLGGGSALVRGAIFNVIAAVPGIGFIVHVLVILSDTSQHQGIHDRAAGARIVPANIDPAVARLHDATAGPAGSVPHAPVAYGSGAPHVGGRPDSHDSAYFNSPASAPPEAPSWLNPDATQPINSPLARSLDAPPPASAPPAPLPSWLDRHSPAADPVPPAEPTRADPPPAADSASAAGPVPPAPTPPPGVFPQAADQAPSAPTGQAPSAPSQVPTAPAGQAPSQIDDEVEMTRLVQPGRSRRAYRPSAPDPVQGRIRVSDGQVQDIRGTTLVGRNPAPRPGERAVTLLS
ncbi:MAG TPA: RDD family protein, partial [Actinomycetales bacterium]|nr:RDD family protein [Actinomycetales bacterium]